jgi:hypothetical protein
MGQTGTIGMYCGDSHLVTHLPYQTCCVAKLIRLVLLRDHPDERTTVWETQGKRDA